MSKPILLVSAAVVLAAIALFALVPQDADTARNADTSAEAARLNTLGAAYMNQQLFEIALKAFQESAALDPKLQIAQLNHGIALLNLGRVDAARPLLEQAVRQNPADAHAWFNLALLYKNTGDAQAAVNAFKRVTEIDPNDADTWYFLGTSYIESKQYPEAIDAFQRALKIVPTHASAEFGLARAYQQSGDLAGAREHLARFQHIKDTKLGVPISLAYGEQGKYSLAEESPLAPEKVPPAIKVQFADVTAQTGLTTKATPKSNDLASYLGPGACFLDYDGDGRIDIFLPDNGKEGGMSLYHNLGNGRFEDVTRKAGLDPAMHGIGCTAGDYDNDGFTDLAVSLLDRIMLLHNEKNGAFKDVARAAEIRYVGATGLTFIDYDHDGDLDLYGSSGIVINGGRTAIGASAMWRNNGNSTFTDVTGAIGVSIPSSANNAIGTDYNNDRAVDLAVADWSGGTIFQNPREGNFHPIHPFSHLPVDEKKAIDFTLSSIPTVGIAALDFDHDGWMDVALTRLTGPALTLWRNAQGTAFEEVPLPQTNWVRAYGVAAIDYDNDGWVDLVAVGETKEGKGEVRLFRNLGPDGFKDVTADVGLDKIQLKDPRAIITGDYDDDGATDLLITQNHGPVILLRNEGGNKNHWLSLI